MKIKIIEESSILALEHSVNEFIKNYDEYQIKLQYFVVDGYYSVMITVSDC